MTIFKSASPDPRIYENRRFYKMGGYKNIPKIEALKLDNVEHLKKMCEYYINLFCEEYKIEDIAKISENRFNACLMYIYSNYFRLSKYTDKKRAPAIDSVIDYTDIGQLDAILKSYLYICALCDKIPSLKGFSNYSGISVHIIEQWNKNKNDIDIYNINTDNVTDEITDSISIYNNIINNINNINSNTTDNNNTITDYDFINTIKSITDINVYKKCLDVYKSNIYNILLESKENALSDRLATGGQVLGCIAILNHQYGWQNNDRGTTATAPQISISDLPKLEDNSTQKD